jgi:large repetitive protein
VIRLKTPPPPDTTAPETTLGSGGPDATTTSTSASFGFSSNEAGASFECALDSGSYAPCTSPKQYTELSVGAHEFRVRAVDQAGNRDGSPAVHNWTVEAPPTPACDGTPMIASALADSWNGQTAATTNHGGDTVLRVNARSGQRDRTLIKFDNPVLGEGCTVASAKLRLYSSSFKSGRTLQAYRLGGSWAEGGVNWNSQPMPTGAAASAPSRSSAGWVEWNVTAQVQAMYAAGSNHGFLIRDANEGGNTNHVQQFHSREATSGNTPQLVLTFE